MAVSRQARPFGIRDKVGYLFGDFGNDFTFILSSSFLLKFYTDVMGVEAAAVGFIMMAARFVDAFTDVAMGRICDRSRLTSAGRFRPWILRMCVPVALASFLIYQPGLEGWPTALKTAYLLVTYILWGSVFYTSINIPYGSMASAISPEPEDRQSLSTFRTMGGALAGAVIGAGVPVLAYVEVNGNSVLSGERFLWVSAGCSVLAVICHLICYALVTERVRHEAAPSSRSMNVVGMLRRAVRSRALLSVVAASVAMLLAQLTMQSMAGFVYPNYYNSPGAQSASTFTMLAGMALAAAFAKPLARRFGKAELSAAATALAAVISLALFFLRPANVWVFVVVQGISWLGLGVFSMVTWALVGDVIDDAQVRSGVREDGSVYALYSFARKLGQAAAAGLSGSLLTWIGYSQETAFDPEVVSGLYSIATLVPAIGFFVLAAILRWWYPLNKEKVDMNTAFLKKKSGEKQVEISPKDELSPR